MHLDDAREAETERDAEVDHRVDEARADTLVLLGDRVRQYDRGGGEADVHAKGDDDEAEERLRPVGLAHGRRGEEDGPDEVREQGEHHGQRGADAVEEQAREDGGARARDGVGRVPGRGEQRGRVPEELEELPDVEEEDAEAGPAAGDAGEDGADVGVEALGREERGGDDAGFEVEEGGDEERAEDEGGDDVGLLPADQGALVPGEVDEDEGCHARDAAKGVQLAKSMPSGRLVGFRFGESCWRRRRGRSRDEQLADEGCDCEDDGEGEEGPWPPGERE